MALSVLLGVCLALCLANAAPTDEQGLVNVIDIDLCAVDGKKDCGYYGISETQCLERGCCWRESQLPGEPWCFFRIGHELDRCAVPFDQMEDCGENGISEHQCQERGCCWFPSDQQGAPWCFHSNVVVHKLPVYTDEDLAQMIEEDILAASIKCPIPEPNPEPVIEPEPVPDPNIEPESGTDPTSEPDLVIDPEAHTDNYSPDAAGPCEEDEIRLYNSEDSSSLDGLAQICRNNTWGTMCDNGFQVEGWPTLFCKQLGYASASDAKYCGHRDINKCVHNGDFPEFPVNYAGVRCVLDRHQTIGECKYDAVTDCGHDKDVYIFCQ